jgi:hypothetical protein
MNWCRDVARDEAVRAAEDAAAADRPTLPDHRELPAEVEQMRSMVREHIGAFAELVDVVGRINARLERLEAMMAEQENKGESMTRRMQ